MVLSEFRGEGIIRKDPEGHMDHHVLHARDKELLHFLSSRHGIVTAKEIAKKLTISERTIRSDIARINQAVKNEGILIRSIYGKGYSLEIQDRTAFHHLFTGAKSVQTKEDRIRYLILRLIRSEGSCDLDDLEEDIYISRPTLESDLKEVRARICEGRPFLQMERRGSKLLIEDNELKRRYILIYLYSKAWDYDSAVGITLKDSSVDQEVLDEIRTVVKQVLNQYAIALDDFGQVYVILSLAVCYARLLEGKELLLPDDWEEGNLRKPSRKILLASQELLERVSKIWELTLEPDVFRWLPTVLYWLSMLNLRFVSLSEALEKVDAASVRIAESVWDRAEENFGISFREDEGFCANLLLHIQALRNGMLSLQPQNPYALEGLRHQSPFLGAVAHDISAFLEKQCEIRLDIDEENYLLPLLALFQNRRLERLREKRLRVSVVSHYSSVITEYLMGRLERIYGSRVLLDGPYPVYDRDRLEDAAPACILTTVQMDVFRQYRVPVITVSAQLTRSDQEKIDQQMQKLELACLYEKLPMERSQYFREEWTLYPAGRPELPEILEAMAEQVRSRLSGETVPDEKTMFSLKSEDCYFTLFSDGTLFTYAVSDAVDRSIFLTSYPETAISWKRMKGIKRVLLLVLHPDERKLLGSFYQLAAKIAEPDSRREE